MSKLFYDNNFFKAVDVSDINPDDAQKYRNIVSERRKQKRKLIANAPEILDNVKPDSKGTRTKMMLPDKPALAEPQKEHSKALRVTAVNVNSVDRDMSLYPKASDFKIYLQNEFKNVYKVSLLSTEWPNTDNVIKETPELVRNNIVAWINYEDGDIGFPVYKAYVRPGTYSPTTLQKELSTKMNLIKTRNGTGPYHSFEVAIDKNTNIITFRRLVNRLLPPDGISFSIDSNDVIVNLPLHGLTVGTQIYVSGVRSTAGTITPAYINNSFYITSVIDENSFKIELPIPSSVSMNGGGISTNIGVVRPFKFKFGGSNGTIGIIIGFAQEDSNILINQSNALSPRVLRVSNVIIGNPTVFVSHGHGLQSGMKIRIDGLDVLPKLDNTLPLEVFSVPDVDSFVVNIITTDIEQASISKTLIGTELMNINFPGHGFNSIVSIEPYGTGMIAKITTLLPHNFLVGLKVILNQTNSSPHVDGVYEIISITGTDSFTIQAEFPLIIPGYSGIIGNSSSFRLYNCLDVGSVPASSINDQLFTIHAIEDADNFLFQILNMNTTDLISGGGNFISISSELHGFSGVQTNTDSDNNLIRPVTLSGESYVFLCLKDLGCIVNTGPVKDIFAKILLNQPPGAILFNTFVQTPGKIFDEKLLDSMTYLDIKSTTHKNAPFEFNSVDFSFTLEITEIIDQFID